MSDCVFCKIIEGSIPCSPVYSDERCLVFKDIHPKAPTHLLLVPKAHIESVAALKDEDAELVGHIFKVARDVAKDLGLSGYKLNINVGEHGGQEVFHLHVHLLSNFES